MVEIDLGQYTDKDLRELMRKIKEELIYRNEKRVLKILEIENSVSKNSAEHLGIINKERLK